MALNINGTTGISGVDGSVSAPALTGTDSNTGITFPSADTIKFSTGGVERMSITNSGVSATGHILQVVSTFKNDTTSTTSTSFVDISGMSVSITPSSTNSKILILVSLGSISPSTGGIVASFKLLRDSTAVGNSVNTSGLRVPAFTAVYSPQSYIFSASHIFLDSPSTTSATTYKVQWIASSGTIYLNKYAADANNDGSSSITVMEVAA